MLHEKGAKMRALFRRGEGIGGEGHTVFFDFVDDGASPEGEGVEEVSFGGGFGCIVAVVSEEGVSAEVIRLSVKVRDTS